MLKKKIIAVGTLFVLIGVLILSGLSYQKGIENKDVLEHESKELSGKVSNLYMKEAENISQDEELEQGIYIETQDSAVAEILDNRDSNIKNIDEIYGDKLSDVVKYSSEELALFYLRMVYEIVDIEITSCVNLYDANSINTYVAYNYIVSNEHVGYIIVSQYMNMILFKEHKENQHLPVEYQQVYYLSEGELYFFDGNSYSTLTGTVVEADEFTAFLKDRSEGYYNLTYRILADIRDKNIVQINNVIYLNENNITDALVGATKYEGQDEDAYGYGGIVNPVEYLEDRYGGTAKLKSGKILTMKNFKMSNLERDVNNCTLTAITRVLRYYYDKYTGIPSSYYTIYRDVKEIAEGYGYNSKDGTFPTDIDDICKAILKKYGYSNSKCSGIYIWSFDSEVKDEIDASRPVIMNILRGYYGNHSVTVCGYRIYTVKKSFLGISYSDTYEMVAVYDGWTSGIRYIDYDAFAYDLITSGFGSFNTIVVKK